jgi:prephenate dehydratase
MARVKVAFQGARGAFSEQACRQLLTEPDLDFSPLERFVDVYEALVAGKVRYAVIPFENTLYGSVHENYDHLLKYKPAILAETSVRIVHNLIGRPEAKFSKIQRAISHPVALSQCIDFFRANSGIKAESHYDTGGSVKTVMEGSDASVAAIASSNAAAYYGGKILKRSIEDDRENYTRFFLLSRRTPRAWKRPQGKLKTSLVFVTKNVSGALFRCMSAFALRDIDLTKIESRPLKGRPFEYLFYVDILGSPDEENCANALRHLGEMTEMLAVLGCYPPAE